MELLASLYNIAKSFPFYSVKIQGWKKFVNKRKKKKNFMGQQSSKEQKIYNSAWKYQMKKSWWKNKSWKN